MSETERRVGQALHWLPAYAPFFDELLEVSRLVREVEWHVTHQGVSPRSIAACCQLLTTATTAKGLHFTTRMLQYFQDTCALAEAAECLLCTSDILESACGT